MVVPKILWGMSFQECARRKDSWGVVENDENGGNSKKTRKNEVIGAPKYCKHVHPKRHFDP